ncbi:MAG: hypothetical protein ACK55S_16835, partial [Planctomycetota bacterium]
LYDEIQLVITIKFRHFAKSGITDSYRQIGASSGCTVRSGLLSDCLPRGMKAMNETSILLCMPCVPRMA